MVAKTKVSILFLVLPLLVSPCTAIINSSCQDSSSNKKDSKTPPNNPRPEQRKEEEESETKSEEIINEKESDEQEKFLEKNLIEQESEFEKSRESEITIQDNNKFDITEQINLSESEISEQINGHSLNGNKAEEFEGEFTIWSEENNIHDDLTEQLYFDIANQRKSLNNLDLLMILFDSTKCHLIQQNNELKDYNLTIWDFLRHDQKYYLIKDNNLDLNITKNGSLNNKSIVFDLYEDENSFNRDKQNNNYNSLLWKISKHVFLKVVIFASSLLIFICGYDLLHKKDENKPIVYIVSLFPLYVFHSFLAIEQGVFKSYICKIASVDVLSSVVLAFFNAATRFLNNDYLEPPRDNDVIYNIVGYFLNDDHLWPSNNFKIVTVKQKTLLARWSNDISKLTPLNTKTTYRLVKMRSPLQKAFKKWSSLVWYQLVHDIFLFFVTFRGNLSDKESFYLFISEVLGSWISLPIVAVVLLLLYNARKSGDVKNSLLSFHGRHWQKNYGPDKKGTGRMSNVKTGNSKKLKSISKSFFTDSNIRSSSAASNTGGFKSKIFNQKNNQWKKLRLRFSKNKK